MGTIALILGVTLIVLAIFCPKDIRVGGRKNKNRKRNK